MVARIPVADLPETDNKPKTGAFAAGSFRVAHSFSFGAEGQRIEADFSLENERIVVDYVGKDERVRHLLRYERTGQLVTQDLDDLKWAAANSKVKRFLSDLLFPFAEEDVTEWLQSASFVQENELLVSPRNFNILLAAFARSFSRTRVYQLSPLQCRRPGVPTPNAELGRHGENLPAFIAFLKRSHPTQWGEVVERMRTIVPNLVDVRTEFTPDRNLTLHFVEEGVGRPWTSNEVSDGTIQSLALFAALYDQRPPFALIEEPENSVHPWIVRNFIDACREVPQKQVIVTTHSPALISYLVPAEVAVVWRQGEKRTCESLWTLIRMRRGCGRKARRRHLRCWTVAGSPSRFPAVSIENRSGGGGRCRVSIIAALARAGPERFGKCFLAGRQS